MDSRERRWSKSLIIGLRQLKTSLRTIVNQSLREEQSSTGAQHFNSLFKYLAGASTQVLEHEPMHMGEPLYKLNWPRHMHEPYTHVCTKGRLTGVECLHLLGGECL